MNPQTPQEIVAVLDRHIVGQAAAKRAVALALRNRWRRLQLNEALRAEVTPKNILMIGPTGVGKTEIARRLAKLAQAPFLKVEATKFTEVGYVGRDVETIIRDLVENAYQLVRAQAVEAASERTDAAVEERLLDCLLPPPRSESAWDSTQSHPVERTDSAARQLFRRRLRAGELEDTLIDVELTEAPATPQLLTPPGMEEMGQQLQKLFSGLGGKPQRHKLPIKEARRRLRDEEAARQIREDDLKAQAVTAAEQSGIVFIDEIDKVCRRGETQGADVSREGVQRDLLPLIEGCAVTTKYGVVHTDHILFIASGAFHLAKPSDLIPELQGRLPVRVELDALGPDDFERILTEPSNALTEQYRALLATEGLHIRFLPATLRRLAEMAAQVNARTENIGARRLHTLLERLLEPIAFAAADIAQQQAGAVLDITPEDAERQLGSLLQDDDLSRFIL